MNAHTYTYVDVTRRMVDIVTDSGEIIAAHNCTRNNFADHIAECQIRLSNDQAPRMAPDGFPKEHLKRRLSVLHANRPNN